MSSAISTRLDEDPEPTRVRGVSFTAIRRGSHAHVVHLRMPPSRFLHRGIPASLDAVDRNAGCLAAKYQRLAAAS
jgi:hypothetical protein